MAPAPGRKPERQKPAAQKRTEAAEAGPQPYREAESEAKPPGTIPPSLVPASARAAAAAESAESRTDAPTQAGTPAQPSPPLPVAESGAATPPRSRRANRSAALHSECWRHLPRWMQAGKTAAAPRLAPPSARQPPRPAAKQGQKPRELDLPKSHLPSLLALPASSLRPALPPLPLPPPPRRPRPPSAPPPPGGSGGTAPRVPVGVPAPPSACGKTRR